jgi:hypothetical protein
LLATFVLAITEFAPGAEKTKDKCIYTSIGFTAPLLPDSKQAWCLLRMIHFLSENGC